MQTPGGPLQNRKSPRATTNLDNIGDERSPTDAPPPQNRRENAREGFDALGDAADAFAGASARAASSRRSSNPQRQKTKISGKTDPQRPRRTRRRAPAAACTRFPWEGPSRVAVGGRDQRKRASQIFLSERRRRAALDCRPPLRGHGEQKRTPKQQSTGGRRRVGAAGGLRGVMEVTPYGPDRNFRGLAAPGGLRLPLPSPGSKKDQKKTQTTII